MPVLTFPEIIGFSGVLLLLTAFALNLANRLNAGSTTYLTLNALGAGLAAWSSWLIGFMPFVLLEGTWCVVALFTVARQFTGRAGSST